MCFIDVTSHLSKHECPLLKKMFCISGFGKDFKKLSMFFITPYRMA